MILYKEQKEFEEAIKDAVKIRELDPTFSGIGATLLELETL